MPSCHSSSRRSQLARVFLTADLEMWSIHKIAIECSASPVVGDSGGDVIEPHRQMKSIRKYWTTYRDEFAPVGKISCRLTYSVRSALMSASKTNGSTTPAWLIAIRSSRSNKTNGMDQQEAEATSNTRHWASRDTTSSGTRIITDLSHDACSSRLLLSLSPVLAASV